MATIVCPHCAMKIQFASSSPGKYQCPNCKGILKLVNPNNRAVKWWLITLFVVFLLVFIAVGLILLAVLSVGGGGYMA